MHRMPSKLTYANVMATLAMFVALGGGAYAAIDLVGRNDIKSRHIAPNAAKGNDVNEDTLQGAVFAYGQIREDASIRNASRRVLPSTGDSVAKDGTGIFCVELKGNPTQEEQEATVVSGAGTSDAAIGAITNGQGGDCGTVPGVNDPYISVRTYNAAGQLADRRFSFIVP